MDSGSATPAMIVARTVRRNSSTTSTTRPAASTSVNSTSRIEARIVSVESCTTFRVVPAASTVLELRQLAQHAVHRLDHVGAGLALHVDDHGGLARVPAADAAVLQPVDDVGDVAQQHGGVVAIGDDDGLVGGRRVDLVVGRDRVGLGRAVDRALGGRDVGGHDGGAQVLEADAVGGEARQVGLDADGGADVALDRHVADARHLRDLRRQHRVGDVGELAQRRRARGQRQRQHRRVGRVHLGIGGRVGKVARQRRGRGVDAGLHVLRGRVDVAVEVELQRDLAEPEGALRRHRRRATGSARTAAPASAVTSVAIVSGLAPGSCVVTCTVGKSTCGSDDTESCR